MKYPNLADEFLMAVYVMSACVLVYLLAKDFVPSDHRLAYHLSLLGLVFVGAGVLGTFLSRSR